MAVQKTTRLSLSQPVVALLGFFFIASYHLQAESLSTTEGYALWAVYAGDIRSGLYFLLLNGWVFLTGESVYTTRLFSTFLVLLALAIIYRISRYYMLILLIIGLYSIYAARTADFAALLLALVVGSLWVYLRWLRGPTILRRLLHMILLIALLITSPAGLLMILAQIFHLLYSGRSWRRLWPYLVAVSASLPWINLDTPLAGEYWGLVLLAVGIGYLRRHPGVLILVLLVGVIQLAAYPRPPNADWERAVRQVTAVRQPLEPIITNLDPQSPAAYYGRLYGMHRGIAVDLAWRDPPPDEMRDYIERLQATPSIWVVWSANSATIDVLSADRSIGYHDTVLNTVFYRFDREP